MRLPNGLREKVDREKAKLREEEARARHQGEEVA